MSTHSATYVPTLGARDGFDREPVLVASAVTIGVIMSILEVTVAGDAIEALVREIQGGLSTMRWVVTGYALALGTLIPLAVWADRLATERVHLILIALSLLWSILLGLGWRWIFLINVPVGAVALLMTALLLPPHASPRVAKPRAAGAQGGTLRSTPGTVPGSLSRGQQRVVAAFLRGRLPAGRVHAELAQARDS
jgi:MFS family permease